MSYYDVDAILTDSQKLPCTFELDVPGLGFLDGNPGQTVRSNVFYNDPIGDRRSIDMAKVELICLDNARSKPERKLTCPCGWAFFLPCQARKSQVLFTLSWMRGQPASSDPAK